MVVAVVEVLNHIYRKYSEVFRFTKIFGFSEDVETNSFFTVSII